jgi:hypothetical protein
MASRLQEVNRALIERGRHERLSTGGTYYYFRDGETSRWPESSVYVSRADQMTVGEWLAEFDRLLDNAHKYDVGES